MKVCSYSFFRSPYSGYESERCGESRGRFFSNFLRSLIRAHPVVWQGWELWIHHDDSVRELPYFKVLSRLHDRGMLKLIPFGTCLSLCGAGGMLERLQPLFNQDVEYVVCRDVDSLPMPRDEAMVSAFIEAHGGVHCILDSISHSGPMMGGTVAFDAAWFRRRFEAKSLGDLMSRADGLHLDYNVHGTDQVFLNSYLWPNACTAGIIHAKDRSKITGPCKRLFDTIPQQCEADRLSNHVGGVFDVDRAVAWYDRLNHPAVELVKECERG